MSFPINNCHLKNSYISHYQKVLHNSCSHGLIGLVTKSGTEEGDGTVAKADEKYVSEQEVENLGTREII